MSRIQYCAVRCFPIYENELPQTITDIAKDGRAGYKHGFLKEQTVRWFRAFHTQKIRLRKRQLKETVKLFAEHPYHARACRKALEIGF